MKKRSRSAGQEPTMMIHHVREIQFRLLAVVLVLIIGMAVGYIFYEPLFAFVKAPLHAPLHYMSPAGSFTLVVKLSLVAGVITALPVAVYNAIMFVQPALKRQLSRRRVYLTSFASLILATGGAAFGFFFILPMALQFFYKFQVNGLEAIISADEYLRFVAGILITFVLIFQLPLLISLADHIRPLPPKKLLKLEKYVIIGSIVIAIAVPFSFDPIVQLLIASPIIILYNLSVLIVLIQHFLKRRAAPRNYQSLAEPLAPAATNRQPQPAIQTLQPVPMPALTIKRATKSLDGITSNRQRRPVLVSEKKPLRPQVTQSPSLPSHHRRLISDIRPIPSGFQLDPS